ncbi:hypothetical protein D9756_004532 [Leucocoprinus leucothites]|uniref:F-box domain-containing protein n=1 Tax=Leucocoprinus leucothites TaxID=201217 RepID=A0A8H5GA09_9AGAR|nr:hypothetical protein D9756_004532 [Leucoagaricus leucothites]
MSQATLTLSRLPTELWYHSFTFLNKNDLRHLCLVSKDFLPEGRRLLYRDVALKGSIGMMLWTEMILSSDVHPPLVRSVTLPTRANLTGYYIRALTRCLSMLPRLTALNIKHAMTVDSTNAYLVPEMLEGCSSCLVAFHHDLADIGLNHSLFSPSGFYSTHAGIERLYLANTRIQDFLPAHLEEKIPPNILPRLLTLHIENLEILRAFRAKPIRRLRISETVFLTPSDIEKLGLILDSFRNTLSSLCIKFSSPISPSEETSTLAEVMEMLVMCAPKLSHLYIFGDVPELISGMHSDAPRFSSSLRALSNLTCLVFGISRLHRQHACLSTDSVLPETLVDHLFMWSDKLQEVTIGCFSPVKASSSSLFGRNSASFVRSSAGGVDRVSLCQVDCTLTEDAWATA